MDLTGKLIIKARLGDDIRLTPIHNEDITYDELILMMQRVFRGKIQTNDELTIKYTDEDGDLITIFDSSDLSFAIQCSRKLKITIFVNSKPRPLESDQVKYLKSELRDIRNRVTLVLDQLDTMTPSYQADVDVNDHDSSLNHQMEGKLQIAAGGKEFDPLSSQPRQAADDTSKPSMTSYSVSADVAPPVANQRPASPTDSISSTGSSASQRHQQQQKSASPFPSQQQNPQGFPPQQQQHQHQQHFTNQMPDATAPQSQPQIYQPGQPPQQGQYAQPQMNHQYNTGGQYSFRPNMAPGQYPVQQQQQQQQQQQPQQQQQQPYNPQGMPPVPNQQQQYAAYNQQGGPGAPPGGANPYSRPGYQMYNRPPAATYQQGYQ